MKRRAFTILSGASLVLWLAVAVVFVRSFWVMDLWGRRYLNGTSVVEVTVGSSVGRIMYESIREQFSDVRSAQDQAAAAEQWRYWGLGVFPEERAEWYKPAFDSGPRAFAGPAISQFCTTIRIPYWLMLLPLTIAPALWLRGFRRERRRWRLGLYLGCGYDLCASEGKCPECGTAIPADLVRKPLE